MIMRRGTVCCLILACMLLLPCLTACSALNTSPGPDDKTKEKQEDTSGYLIAIEDEPDTVDFQCTTIHYTVAQNVFNRLVEMESDSEGNAQILPSLAESWEISDDRLSYTFHLRDGVTFSNGSPLTSEDVLFTIKRVLTHPDSCNEDIADNIAGAKELEAGESENLEGFKILNDHDFVITLQEPFEAFLASLTMPGASILDKETLEGAGSRFGIVPKWTVGTGPFILDSWEKGTGMTLTANPDCWQGAPSSDGLKLFFATDPEEIRMMFEEGNLDILNLDDIGKSSEYFLHGDTYEGRVFEVPRICIVYIALNESMKPLNDVRVRKALQLSLNRLVLLDAAYSGHGSLENGIMPHGLYGFDPELEEIPYDPQTAKELISEAGYPDGFDLTVSVSSASSLGELSLIRAAQSMWGEIGVNVLIRVIDDNEFMRLRKKGALSCYSATWSADYNDPDNFFYTFFGNKENTRYRSLCYGREDIMERVTAARAIADPEERIREYRELQRIIVQEDAAWIPLFSRTYHYVCSERLNKIEYSWNGSVKNRYRDMSVSEVPES